MLNQQKIAKSQHRFKIKYHTNNSSKSSKFGYNNNTLISHLETTPKMF